MKNNDIFQHQTIAQLAAVIQEDTVLEIDQGLVTGKVALIPIQHTFFARELPQPAHYNQFVWVETTQTLNIDHLRQAFATLLLHHDALRLRYRWQAEEWQQFCDSSTETIPLFVETLTAISETEQLQLIKERTEHYQTSLDLESGPLLCLVVFKLGLTTRLLWCIHHLLVDGVSWRILLDDLQTAYQQLSQGMGVKLPQKTSSFKVWAENLTRYAQSKELTQQIPYWQTMLSHHFTLPVDNLSGANTLSSTQDYFVSLDKVETDVLLKEANTAYQTRINDLLLTALAHTLSAWTGQRDCLIDLESHGRVNLFKALDISRTVGWFTAIYPVQLRLPATDEWDECIRAIKKQLRQVPDEGIGYGLLHAFGQGISFPASTGQVLFNYLGQFDQTVEEGVFHPVSGKDAFGLSQSDQGERDYLLEINGAVQNGCLMFSWSYSCDVHQETTIQRLAERYLQTLRALIAHCKNILPHAQEAEASLIAAIRPAGVKLPFFCLPGMQGLPRYLYPLAHQLDIEHPFYGLYAPEIVGQPTCTSVETLATCYLAAIKTVQSQGPYQIGGHSFGAVVAFEIARQLEKANEVVSLLVLIDEPVPVREGNAVTAKKNELEALVDYLKWLAYFNDFAMYDGDLSSYTPDERLELAVNFLNQAGLALDKQELQTTLRAFTNNYQCYNRYIPQGKLSRSRVVLLQSSEKESAHKEPSLGWQQYVTQPIEVYKVAGGHFTMFANPYVKTMAEIMSDILA
jgi:non-ribosomal peptide synthase protein (TIGR01720 family)